ncbi:hypothetical protein CRYUN_Cryun20dG0014000 [Craigia yunnanensis]
MIARGVMLGPDQPVILHMLDIEPAAEALKGVKMELMDAAFPLLRGVIATTDVAEACKGSSFSLEQHAAPDCKVLVVANPANTNALILKEFAPSIPEKNITCLTRLDHNRALGQISERLNVHVSEVKNVIIWGNHSSTQYPDVNHATVITTNGGEKPVRDAIANDNWLNTEFITTMQQRGAAIIKARKLSSALSAASAACDHIRDWVLGTPKGTWVSMGVYSDRFYGIQPGIIYSFPLTCEKGQWSIVQVEQMAMAGRATFPYLNDCLLENNFIAMAGLKIDEFSREKMDAAA